ncbi:MAG TPA: HEAT repeat domain-containing protein [Polyangia bacterium]|jgi:HEAT repeat protein|nr:HEAT repeat domain-containing protein [Polyangia bacterium]
MRTDNKIAHKIALAFLASTLVVGAASGTALAGRGGSPQAIQSAIDANSVDAIQAELERSEHLVCSGCTDMVLPLVDHLNYRVRQAAAWWLARRGTSRQVYVQMLNRLSQSDSTLARNAADVLGEFRAGSSIPALSAALSNPIFTGEARAAMAQALGNLGNSAAAAPLTQALTVQDPLVKAAALQALRSVPGFHDGTVAVSLVGDADSQVRSEAAVTLGILHTTAGANALVQALASDPSALVRKKAAWALGEMNAPLSVAGTPLQLAATNDTNPFVRSIAQVAISRLAQ